MVRHNNEGQAGVRLAAQNKLPVVGIAPPPTSEGPQRRGCQPYSRTRKSSSGIVPVIPVVTRIVVARIIDISVMPIGPPIAIVPMAVP